MAAGLAFKPLGTICFEDNSKDADLIKANLSRTGNFAPQTAPNFDDAIQDAQGKESVLMDIFMNNDTEGCVFAARDLFEDNPLRPIYCFTSNPWHARLWKDVPVNYLVEKNAKAFEQLEYINGGIIAQHRSMYIAKRIEDIHSTTENNVSQKAMDLFSLIQQFYSRLNKIKASVDELNHDALSRYEALENALRPVCVNGLKSAQSLTLSTSELEDIKEILINFAFDEREKLQQIEGVTATHFLDSKIAWLKEHQGKEQNQTVADDVKRKYAEIEFPSICQLHERLTLKITIKEKEEKGNKRIDIDFDKKQEVEVMVHLSGDGFLIPNSFKMLMIPRYGDSKGVELEVEPKKRGQQHLFLNFYKDAMRIATIVVQTQVSDNGGTADAAS